MGGGPLALLAGRALDLLLPPRCLGCGTVVDTPGALCPACWEPIDFLGPPWCAVCGTPFEVDLGPGTVCGNCLRHPPPYRRARAVFAYGEASRGLLLAFKHADRTDAAPAFARWMVRAGAELVAEAEVVVPVPLHWTRLLRRRYNQAALLAGRIAKIGGIRFEPRALVRKRRTVPLGHLGRAARRRLLGKAIELREGAREAIAGRRVLLIDDVLTTGATASACAKALLHGGATSVDVLTLARVVRPEA